MLFRHLIEIFYAWRYFHLTQRRLHLISWYLQLKSSKINANTVILNNLNIKREKIQREITYLSKGNLACSRCKGKCCIGDHNLFTATDALLRKYSDKPLSRYGITPKNNELLSNYHALKKHLSYFIKNPNRSTRRKAINCSFLKEQGCSLQPEDRPIHCLIFTCSEFRNQISYDKFVKLSMQTKLIQSIENNIIRLFDRKTRYKLKLQILFSI